MLFCIVLCFYTLDLVVLCRILLSYILYFVVLYCIVSLDTIFSSFMLHYVFYILYFVLLYCILLLYIIFSSFMLYYVFYILYFVVLYRILLLYIIFSNFMLYFVVLCILFCCFILYFVVLKLRKINISHLLDIAKKLVIHVSDSQQQHDVTFQLLYFHVSKVSFFNDIYIYIVSNRNENVDRIC